MSAFEALKPAVLAHKDVQAARKAVEAARGRRETIASEVADLRAQLHALESRLAGITESGDPEGVVRELSQQRRALRGTLEDAEADLSAHDAALDGALREQNRAVLEAMDPVWDGQDIGGVIERFQAAALALAAAADEVEALTESRNGMINWASHILGRLLDGEGPGPRLAPFDLGTTPPHYALAARAVWAVRQDIIQNTQKREVAA